LYRHDAVGGFGFEQTALKRHGVEHIFLLSRWCNSADLSMTVYAESVEEFSEAGLSGLMALQQPEWELYTVAAGRSNLRISGDSSFQNDGTSEHYQVNTE